MSYPKRKPKVPNRPPEVLARYRSFLIELLEQKGFMGAKTPSGDFRVVGGFARFDHSAAPIGIWIARRYVRLFCSRGGKKTDIGWFAITQAREINQMVDQHLSAEAQR